MALANFLSQWTGARRLDITTKDTALFPEFSDDLRAAMQAELPAFLDYVLWTGDHTLRTLLTAPVAFVNEPLAQVYGVTAPRGGTALQLVELPPEQGRAGLLTQAGFLSVQAHPDQTSPVLRGKFVRSCSCANHRDHRRRTSTSRSAESRPQRHGARALWRALGRPARLQRLSPLMDPIGFSFEHFDAMGRHRELETAPTSSTSPARSSRTRIRALPGPSTACES